MLYPAELQARDFIDQKFLKEEVVRPERFELPTLWFVAKYSIQLSYGRFARRAEKPGHESGLRRGP